VVAPYTGADTLFGPGMSRSAIGRRYTGGASIVTRPPGSVLPAGHDLLFLIRADGRLAAVTESGRPLPEPGDTMVTLGPGPGTAA
jgi:hypothetical protein